MIDLIDVLPEPDRPINRTFFVIGDAISTSPGACQLRLGPWRVSIRCYLHGRRRAYGSVPPSYVCGKLVWTVLANLADSFAVASAPMVWKA